MVPKKGQSARTPGSGRKPGTPNGKTRELADRAAALGCDPFEILCRFAMGDWHALGYSQEARVTSSGKGGDTIKEYIPPELRASCAGDLAQYLYPRRKAIEHTLDPEGEGFRVVVVDYGSKPNAGSGNRAPAKTKTLARGD